MSELDLPTDGPVAPPRANGELVFDAPWQSRAFGIAASLVDEEQLEWPDFQAALIRHVPEHNDYWDAWLAALIDLGASLDLFSGSALSTRTEELLARPAGHDH